MLPCYLLEHGGCCVKSVLATGHSFWKLCNKSRLKIYFDLARGKVFIVTSEQLVDQFCWLAVLKSMVASLSLPWSKSQMVQVFAFLAVCYRVSDCSLDGFAVLVLGHCIIVVSCMKHKLQVISIKIV